MDRKYKLHSLMLDYAPNADAQELCTVIYNRMQRDGLSDERIELNIVQALHDGLAFGNWVWSVPDIRAAIELQREHEVVELNLPLDNPDESAHTWPGKCMNCGQAHDGPDADQLQTVQPDASAFYICRVCGNEKPIGELTGHREDGQWYWACRSHS